MSSVERLTNPSHIQIWQSGRVASQQHESRFTFHVPCFTFHVSRFTLHTSPTI
ncbi:hypothetical protein QUF80_08220 [Desulfococcaceae bacterium HSG8]|nr:hypothetical protein [Desulfococcaceae bacterium HSG8]